MTNSQALTLAVVLLLIVAMLWLMVAVALRSRWADRRTQREAAERLQRVQARDLRRYNDIQTYRKLRGCR